MRKESRQMSAEWALEVFDKAPYITVSMADADVNPYGLPLSLVRTDEKTFWFHCATEGKKLDILKYNPRVFLSAVTRCRPLRGPKDGSFTLEFQSATAVGIAEIVEDENEKKEALRAICQRFLPQQMEGFEEAAARSLHRTAVVRITLVYVMSSCPDCFEVKARLSDNPEFEIIDIGEYVRKLKEFIRLRDTSPAFDTVKANGSIGIPCFVSEDGRISFDTEAFIPEELPSGASCSLDGKGC